MIDRRAKFRKGLHALYLPYYDALCGVLEEIWQPISGLRSYQEQADLYALGRTLPGDVVTKAQPGMSMHNYGIASDWAYFEEGKRFDPITYDDPKWKEYIDACEKVGVRCLDYERPHNELPIKTRVYKLCEIYQQAGMEGVTQLLEKEKTDGTIYH